MAAARVQRQRRGDACRAPPPPARACVHARASAARRRRRACRSDSTSDRPTAGSMRVAGAQAPAAEIDDRQADLSRVHRSEHSRRARRGTSQHHRRTRQPGEAGEQHVGRPAERRAPCVRSARPPRRRPVPGGPSRWPCAASSATPPSASISAASASVTSFQTRLARRAAGEEVDRLAHLERVAGRAAEHLVHVGDQRARRQAARARPRRSGSWPARARPPSWRRRRRCRP